MSTVGLDEAMIRAYIKKQEQKDKIQMDLPLKERPESGWCEPPLQGGLMIPPVHCWYSFDTETKVFNEGRTWGQVVTGKFKNAISEILHQFILV